MLKLILGRAGSGKTYMSRKIILEKSRLGESKLMLLVPEQMSFENEKVMLNLLGTKGNRVLEITTFTRLADFVFRRIGGFAGTRIDDGGRNMIMSLAIEQVRPYLSIYKNSSQNVEFVKLMVSTMKEFKTCSISSKNIENVIARTSDLSLRDKLKDTNMILSAYDSIIKKSYLDPIDDLTKLYEMLLENEIFNEYIVVIDSFDGFSHQELKVIERIMIQSKELYITLCTEKVGWNKRDFDIFSWVRQTANQILIFAKNNDVEVSDPIIMNRNYRFYDRGITELENGIFQMEKKVLNGKINDVTIFNAVDQYDEISYVARTIRKLIIENEISYRDVTIISRSQEKYEEIIEIEFSKYDIPVFMDKNEPIDSKPLMNFIVASLEILISNFKTEYIFKLLKTGLLSLSVEEISIIENYVLLWGINGQQWLDNFTSHPDGFSKVLNDKSLEQLDLINNIRQRIIDPINNFKSSITKHSGKDISKSLYFFLEEVSVKDNLVNFYRHLNDMGEKNFADEQIRLWDLLMKILDQMAMVLKDSQLTLKRYKELLKLTIDSNKISFIPQGLDEVKFGSADRIRPNHPRIVFLIGAIQGEFPLHPFSTGIFSDFQRKKLISMGLDLDDSLEGMSLREQFIAYKAVTSPSEHLFITWNKVNLSGGVNYPSSIVMEIKNILPGVEQINSASEKIQDTLFSERSSFLQYAKCYNDDSIISNTLRHYFMNSNNYKNKIKDIDMMDSNKLKVFHNKLNVDEFFGKHMCLSASQVEKFYLCRFQYFCKYGIKAKVRKPAVFDAIEYGTLIHFVLEDVFSRECEKKYLKKEIQKCLNNYLNSKLGGIQNKTSRFMYLYHRLSKSIEIVVTYIFEKNLENKFKPRDFEVVIKDGCDLIPLKFSTESGSIKIEGKIDRIDTMNKDGVVYLRIVDYKSGTKQFNLSDVIYGLNMQMLIYLASIIKNGGSRYGNIVPAGVLYMPTTLRANDLNRSEKDIIKVNKKRLESQFKMDGLILDDPNVIFEMKKDSRTNTLISLSEMGMVLNKVEGLILDMSKLLKEGDVSASPLSGNVNSCEYCEYSSICGIEESDPHKNIQNLEKEQIFNEIMK